MKTAINFIFALLIALNALIAWVFFVQCIFGDFSHVLSIISNSGIAFGLYMLQREFNSIK